MKRVCVARRRRTASPPGPADAGAKGRCHGTADRDRCRCNAQRPRGVRIVDGRCRARAAGAVMPGGPVAGSHATCARLRCVSHRLVFLFVTVLQAAGIGAVIVACTLVAGGGRSEVCRVQTAAEGEVHHRGDGRDDADEGTHVQGSREERLVRRLYQDFQRPADTARRQPVSLGGVPCTCGRCRGRASPGISCRSPRVSRRSRRRGRCRAGRKAASRT